MKATLISLNLFVVVLIGSCGKIASNDKTEAKPLALNSLGIKVQADTVLKKYPYVINRCDQIAVVKGQYVPDFEDYTQRTEAYFVLTAYHVSMFKDDNADNLLQSVPLHTSSTVPQNLRGARGCISVEGVKGNKMAICTENQKNADNLLLVLRKFFDCRGSLAQYGKTFKLSMAQLKALLKGCPLAKFNSVIGLKKKLKEYEQKEKAKKNLKIYPNTYFHPGGEKVPGTH